MSLSHAELWFLWECTRLSECREIGRAAMLREDSKKIDGWIYIYRDRSASTRAVLLAAMAECKLVKYSSV